MDGYRLLKEAMHFLQKYQFATLAVFLGEDNARRAQERGILRDIAFLRRLGFNIVIGHYIRNLDTSQWFDLAQDLENCELRNLDKIRNQIAIGKIPVIYCEDTPDLSCYHTMAFLAANIGAKKIVYVTRYELYDSETGQVIPEMSTEAAKKIMLSASGRMKNKISAAIEVCERWPIRAHIINGARTGALIREIFSSEGSGTMIHEKNYRVVRQARPPETADIADILRLATPSFQISPAEILESINEWHVLSADDQLQAAMRLTNHSDGSMEVSYLSTIKAYDNQRTFKMILWQAIGEAHRSSCQRIFLEKNQNLIWIGIYPWFHKEMGFRSSVRGKCLSCISSNSQNPIWIKDLQEA